MRVRTSFAAISAFCLIPGIGYGEVLLTYSKNMYGAPGGLIDMPSAEMAPDGEFSSTVSHFGGTTKSTLTFQILPRLTGTFRYSALKEYRPGRGVAGAKLYPNSTYYDRSFDLRYQLVTEGEYRPAVAVGMRDFVGTGLYSSEYLVATKSIGSRLRVTGGLGWGRLGSFDSFGSTGTRPPTGNIGAGGNLRNDRWFRGPVSAFGGVSYQATDRLKFTVEYSSDAYLEERGGGNDKSSNMFQRESPWNFGVDYKVNRTFNVGAYYMYGSEIGIKVSLALDTKGSPVPGGSETAPLPVAVRPKYSARDLGWTAEPGRAQGVQADVATGLANEGMVLEGMRLEANSARVLIRNPRFDVEAQAIGRTARVLSRTLPASVEKFTIVQTHNGMPAGAVTIKRSDIERLENAPASNLLGQVTFSGAANAWDGVNPLPGTYPRLSWSLGPYAKMSVFDPDNPVRVDVGLKLDADYFVAPGWVVSGTVTVKAGGNIGDQVPGRNTTGTGPGTLPPVRSDASKYSRGNDPRIEHLTIAKYGRLGEDIYGRATLGYLETMYAGISGEALWKPATSRLALGAELNYVVQRDFDQLFGVQDYNVATGHVSAYYDLGNGFHGQLDVGRYLARDWGATVSIDREFDNGWKVGAYVTKTDVSAEAFGEGSFDKGIRITAPMSWAIGSPTKRKNNIVIQSLSRNGGARLNVNGRLYDSVRDTHRPEMAKTWGRFWR